MLDCKEAEEYYTVLELKQTKLGLFWKLFNCR